PIVKGAVSVLVTGSLARRSVTGLGAAPERVRVFANTIDVAAYGDRADRLSGRRAELRERLGLSEDGVAVVSVARLVPEKGLGTLVRAVAAADGQLGLVVVSDGPERARLERLAAELG